MKYNHVSLKRLIPQELILILIYVILLIVLSLPLDAGSLMFKSVACLLLIVLFFIGAFYFPALWRNAGFLLLKKQLYIRHGVLFFKQSKIQLDRIISVSVFKTPFSPILKTATVVVKTAGNRERIHGISLKDLKTLLENIVV